VNRTEKVDLVESLHQTFSETAVVVVTRQVGMTVAEVEQLRAAMREAGSGYKVTKNRLARLALKGTQYEGLESLFIGPTAIATSPDPVATAKASVEFANKNDKFSIVAGAIGSSMLSAAEVKALSLLPSIDELRAKLVGLLQAPLSRLVGVLPAPAEKLARVMPAPGTKVARVFAARGQQG
jgi:large subunit ribosomal protein L10